MLYLSHVRLKRDASVSALAPLLLGKTGKGGNSRQPGHHLVWSLFADNADRRRDFLWREMTTGEFLVLSARLPKDRIGLFDVAEPKPFTPLLQSGDRLRFSLRANPVVRRRDAGQRRSRKHDVIMDALRGHARGERAPHRLSVVQERGFSWLCSQAGKSGFKVEQRDVSIEGYRQHGIYRRGGAPAMQFSTLDFEGMLTVIDPEAFLAAIARGFGAAKAYGCGLLLVRRPQSG